MQYSTILGVAYLEIGYRPGLAPDDPKSVPKYLCYVRIADTL